MIKTDAAIMQSMFHDDEKFSMQFFRVEQREQAIEWLLKEKE